MSEIRDDEIMDHDVYEIHIGHYEPPYEKGWHGTLLVEGLEWGWCSGPDVASVWDIIQEWMCELLTGDNE